MIWLRRLLRWFLILGVLGVVLAAAAIGIAYWLVAPRLPNVAEIRDIKLQVPLRVLSSDGKLLAVFGETRRTPIKIDAIPDRLKQAFIAIEDARFYEHPGIDVVGIARAGWLLATSNRDRVPGGSTITQQVARGFFLSNEYSYTRKLTEIFLALRMEKELSKDEILELYLNKIFFGYRAYGVVAAADFYYGKSLDQLSLAECAMLASIPKFPSSGNPLNNPERALLRRNYVLERMLENGFIDQAQYEAAVAETDQAHPHEPPVEVDAPYIAEMVRLEAIQRLGNDAMTAGFVIRTTIDSRLQDGANASLRKGLVTYDTRHGWRGAEGHVELGENDEPATLQAQLAAFRPIAGLTPGVVTHVDKDGAELFLPDGQTVVLPFEAVSWARPYLSESSRGPAPKQVGDVLKRGDIVRVSRNDKGDWRLTQIPKAQSALVALEPENGAIRALVGGFSFGLSKFNRAVQSNRQPGSSFKPFVYSAAFERGFTPASIINDAPLVFADPSQPDGLWKPQNDNEKFYGPMRLREAMVQSRNLVSVRILDAIGVRFAREYITRFGFPIEALPENLSLALGSTSVPPLAMARGYAVIANGGYLVDPYFLDRIENDRGEVVYQANPVRVCRECPERKEGSAETIAAATGGTAEDLGALLGTMGPTNKPEDATTTPPVATTMPVEGVRLAPRVADARNIYLLSSIMRDVIKRGTGRGAMELGRNDLAGKTGTTNEHRDAWFSGFNHAMVTTVWIGFDDFTSLGRGEFASLAALPIWTDFMRVALDGVPELDLTPPAGITTARIDPASGLLSDAPDAIVEVFRTDDVQRLATLGAAHAEEKDGEQQSYEIF